MAAKRLAHDRLQDDFAVDQEGHRFADDLLRELADARLDIFIVAHLDARLGIFVNLAGSALWNERVA